METTPNIDLLTWAKATFGEKAQHINTLRRWARDGRIIPLPTKVGKTWFVVPTAKYQGD